MFFFYNFPHPAKADLVSASKKIRPVALPVRADLSSSETHVAFTLKTAGSTFYAKPKEGHQFGPTRCSSQSNSTKACATRLSPARYWSFTPSWWESQCGVKRSGICRFNSGWGSSPPNGKGIFRFGGSRWLQFFVFFLGFRLKLFRIIAKWCYQNLINWPGVSPGLGRGSWSITKRGN